MLSTYVLVYTDTWGAYSPPTPKYGIQIAIKDNKIVDVSNSQLAIPENGYVITGPKEKLQNILNANELNLNTHYNPQNWEDARHIISGGPYLVKNEAIFIDTKEEKLSSIAGKNPRTAIGYTKNKNLILVTVDGREESSVGMTLFELANFMKEIGKIILSIHLL